MYFSLLPDIQYDKKPISYPFSGSDYIIAKNFFRRYQINPDIFGYATFYDKYTVQDGVKIEEIAKNYYGSVLYDWIIILTNNLINPAFAFPLDSYTLSKFIEEKYGSEAFNIHHYETIEIKSTQEIDNIPITVLEGGKIVDSNFHTNTFTYWNGSEYINVNPGSASKAITNYDYEIQENEKKREVYILKQGFSNRFIEEFKRNSLYSDSGSFISKRLKQTRI